MYLKLVKTTVP